MYKRICDKLNLPNWATGAFKKQMILDMLLEGEIYDHLQYDFTQETRENDEYIPILERRPSYRFNLYKMVSLQLARKLFGGRHNPRIEHDDQKVADSIKALCEEADLESIMMQAAAWGSVGAVAVTFKYIDAGKNNPKLVAETHKARYCVPVFDAFKELKILRINYLTEGTHFLHRGQKQDIKGDEIDEKKQYWYICDHTINEEIIYTPILSADWNPTLFYSDKLKPEIVNEHKLGFVQAQWFINLSGGDFPYGACTWEPAVDNIIMLDYTMSQLGAGVWYNSAPQVMIRGEPANYEYKDGKVIIRGPSRVIQLPVKDKQEDMEKGEGDAKLLEMTGQGTEVGMRYCEHLKKDALEQISASRKDPEKMTTAMSGKGMEVLEQEYTDLGQELRTQYGSRGYLKLIKKMAAAGKKVKHKLLENVSEKQADGIRLRWPAFHGLSAQEFQAIITGLADGVEKLIITADEGKAYLEAQADMPFTSANKAYAKGLETPETEHDNPPKAGNNTDSNTEDTVNVG